MHLFVAANYLTVYCSRVARQPAPGEILLADGLGVEAGGKGLNVAIGARRLGARVEALFGIGRDAAGDALLSLLAAEGIAATHVHRLGERSGHGFGFIAADGSNMGAVFAGANLLLTARHAQQAADAIAGADWVYGVFEAALPAVQACFALARQARVPTLLNPSPWQAIPPALLALTDVLLVNEGEAAALLGGVRLDDDLSALDAAVAALWAAWPGQLLVVTRAARGCVAYRPGRPRIVVPAFTVEAVDTLGAGDAFASGLLCALPGLQADDAALAAALRRACACGAIVASRPGVLGALPGAAEVDGFMRDRSAS
ncbi:MAG: hypothetical protein HZB72_03270 [Burkholderiales bacterium]|nr:hypothetical protein [Burkholderiales bacterium]